MKNIKVLIEAISASDAAGIAAMQKKINQWITTGKLAKYEIHTAAETLVFNIALYKETK